MENGKLIRKVRWPITDAESQAYGKELAQTEKEVVALEIELKRVQATFKGQIATLETKIDGHSEIITSGHHYIEREVVEFIDPVARIVSVCDLQTNVEVASRPATDKEIFDALQGRFFEAEDGKHNTAPFVANA